MTAKKGNIFKVFVFLLVAIALALFLTSCYAVETTDKEEYAAFWEQMESKSEYLYAYLPDPEDGGSIEEMYLYFSEREPLDTTYAIYLNRVYKPEEYEKAVKQIRESISLYDPEEIPKSGEGSFQYDALLSEDILDFDERGSGSLRYSYYLFDEANGRIVCVLIYEKNLFGKSENIPAEYLAKELLSLRDAKK